MELLFTTLKATAPVFALLCLGAAFHKYQWLTPAAEGSIMKMVVSVFYPCLILNSILDNDSLSQGNNLLMAPIIGSGTVLLSFLVTHSLAPRFKIRKESERRTLAFTTGVYNYAYVPIPIIQAIFPGTGLVGVLLVYNLGVEATLWTAGLMVLTGTFGRSGLKKLINPPITALFLGLILNLSGIHGYMMSAHTNVFAHNVYDLFHQLVFMFSKCSIPIGLMICGAALYQAGKGNPLWKQAKISLAACSSRLLLLPILFLLIAKLAPVSMELKQVIVVQASMPAALFPLVLTKYYGGDTHIGVRAILSTTLLSFITIPLWITLGLSFIST